MDKPAIREQVRAARRGAGRDWLKRAGRDVQAGLMTLPEFAEAQVVGCYLHRGAEVATELLVRGCRAGGKQVCVPAWREESQLYELAVLREGARLERGPHGIAEPRTKEWIDVETLELIAVPGVAFDEHGSRVGHGGGYYDRILAARKAAGWLKVGLAFEFQVYAEVPVGAHDVRVDAVITEKRVIRGAGGAH